MELSEDFMLDTDLFDEALIEEYLREKRLRFKCARRRCAEDEASSEEELLRVEGLSSDCRLEETEEALAKEPIKDSEHVEHE
ncbi:unnamed protein product, partial [Toxocara canis]|uniref:snRNA-activating protein complex subunit 3 n=1 Tax=Toxocara canis TaxID=6265 RepID=A0A183U8X8_TOXCA